MFVSGIIDKVIENALMAGRGENNHKRSIGIYYPSELPFCIRKNYYNFVIEKPIKLPQLKLFESGSIYHRWFNNMFENSALVELSVNEHSLVYDVRDTETSYFTLRGRFDDFLYFKLKNILPELELEIKERKDAMKFDSLVLLEVKTVRNATYITSPKIHNVMQLNFYMKLLNVPVAWLVYVDRRDLSHRVFEVRFDELLFKELIERAKDLHAHLIAKELPIPEARLDNLKKWECGYCDYREECIKNKGGI